MGSFMRIHHIYLSVLFLLGSSCFADPHSLYLEAYKYYTRSQYKEAVPLLLKSIDEDNSFPEAYFLLARVLFRKGDPRRAIQKFKQGLALKRKIREHLEQVDSESAMEVKTGIRSVAFRAVIRIQEARKAYYKGKVASRQGQWFEAIEFFERATEFDSERVQYINALGFALLDIKDVYSAEEVLRDSLNKDPRQRDLYEKLISINIDLAEPKQAMKWAEEGLRFFPGHPFFKDRSLFLEHLIRLKERADEKQD
jgi:tetratricopeptide (TPR) repeat protein